MQVGILMMGAAYAVRTMVLRIVALKQSDTISLLGLWVAVCGVHSPGNGSGLLPRLTAIAKDNACATAW